MRIALFLFALATALQGFAQPGENLKITSATAIAAKDSFAVYRNSIMQTLMEGQDTAKAQMIPRSFELTKELIDALSAQLSQQGSSNVVQARLGIMLDANNKPVITLIFETKNTSTQSSIFYDFTRPCPPACSD